MGDGGNTLPRPPRRVPPAAGTLTQLETGTPRAPEPPQRRPWIFGRVLAGFVVLLVIVAGGATAGWYLRAQNLRINTAEVLDTTAHAVVRVLATTCAGTGEATGVLTDDGRILTAASAVDQPRSIVIVTPDNKIRRANLFGTSADGVAVLQLIGQLDGEPLPLATEAPDPKAEHALIGYTLAGKQTIQPVGTTDQPRALGEVMNAEKLGGPVVDKSGQVVGIVVGDTVPAATIVGVDKLRGYVVPRSTGITAGEGRCAASRGPQNGVVPELQVGSTPLAVQAQKLLADYLTLENKRDFPALQALYSKRLKKTLTESRDRQGHQTSYFFGAKITEVSPDGDGAYARLAFNVLFAPTATGADGRVCNQLDQRYHLIREGGALVIDQAKPMATPLSCDSE